MWRKREKRDGGKKEGWKEEWGKIEVKVPALIYLATFLSLQEGEGREGGRHFATVILREEMGNSSPSGPVYTHDPLLGHLCVYVQVFVCVCVCVAGE